MSEPTADDPRRHRRANTVAQLLPLFTGYGLAFVSTPIVVSTIGLRAFGLWAVSGAIAQYGALLDLGIGRAITRFVALHRANGDRHREGQVVATSLTALFSLSVLLGLVMYVVAPGLRGPMGFASGEQARSVLLSAVIILGCGITSQGMVAASFGKGRMVKGNVAATVARASTVIGGLVALLVDDDLETFATGNAVGALLGLLMATTFLVAFDDGVAMARPSGAVVREQLSFGFKGQLQMVSELIVFQSDKVIVGIVVGPSAAGAYEVGNRLALATRSIAVLAGNSLTPELTHAYARDGIAGVRARYLDLTRVTTGLSSLPLLLAAAVTPVLLQAWLDQSPSLSEAVVTALCVTFSLNAATAVTTAAATAIGRPGLPAIYGWLAAGVNIVLAVPLTFAFGARGVLVATAIGVAAGATYGFLLFRRTMEISGRDLLRSLDAFLIGVPLAAVVAVAAHVLEPDGRLPALAWLIALSAVFVAVYVPVGIRRGFLPALRRR